MKTITLFSFLAALLAISCTGTDNSGNNHRTVPDKGPYQYRNDSAATDSTSH